MIIYIMVTLLTILGIIVMIAACAFLYAYVDNGGNRKILLIVLILSVISFTYFSLAIIMQYLIEFCKI